MGKIRNFNTLGKLLFAFLLGMQAVSAWGDTTGALALVGFVPGTFSPWFYRSHGRLALQNSGNDPIFISRSQKENPERLLPNQVMNIADVDGLGGVIRISAP